MNKMCAHCKKEFNGSKLSLYCSSTCKRNNFGYRFDNPPLGHISRGRVGAISELKVCVDLMIKGYDVFRALSPQSNADLVAIKGDVVLKIEVRTARYYTTAKGSKTIFYSKKRIADKIVALTTLGDDKIHYLTDLITDL